MALRAIKRAEPEWYVPEDERGEENPARFKIRGLTSTEQIDAVETFERTGEPGSTTFRYCFRTGCTAIENVERDDGKPIKHPHTFMAQPNFRDFVIEVGAAVFTKSFLREDDEKNS